VTDSLLDRMISYVSPERGARRLAARRAIDAFGSRLSYEGARAGRREAGWFAGTSSANAEISGGRAMLRDRTRSLMRDNAYAVKGLETLVVNRIGTGIITTPDSENLRFNATLGKRWKRWIDRCDFAGRTDLYGIQALAERCRIESGEALIRIVPSKRLDADDVEIRLQVIEPDYIDTTRNERFDNGGEVFEGIENAADGRVVAYWLFNSHPGDSNPILSFTRKSVRVPASQIIHYYRTLRAGQLSGVTEFAPVIRRLYDLDGYADAELMRKKIAACAIGVVTTPGGLPASSLAPTTTDEAGRTLESFAPGMWHYGRPGESIEFFDPKPSDGYAEFFEVELHAIASGLRFPYELLTGDFSKVNYTSFRAALVQFKASIEADQWQLVIPQICQPIWDAFVMEAEQTRVPAKFTPPRFGLLDPAREVPAMIAAVQGGLVSWTETIRREGYEPGEVLDEIEAWQKEVAKRGIVLTSDARVNAGPGVQRIEPAEPAEPKPDAPEPDDEEEEDDEQEAA
jgi:lambda family phage portal protein